MTWAPIGRVGMHNDSRKSSTRHHLRILERISVTLTAYYAACTYTYKHKQTAVEEN